MRVILINDDLGSDNLERLKAQFPQFAFHMEEEPTDKLVAEAEVISGWIGNKILDKAANLKWVHSFASGIDYFIGKVDCLRKDLIVTNGAGVYGVPISEHLLALMLALTHKINLSVRNMLEGKWGGLPHCRELSGSTVGIAGFGDIGSRLAALLQPFGCEMLAFKRTQSERPAGVAEMLYGDEGLDELMRRSDHICVCLPGTPDTKGAIDSRRLSMMKHTASIYNIGRGYIIDTDALVEALQTGRIAGAGLDVTDPEPLPQGHPLWSLPNVIVTPHISGLTQPNREQRLTELFTKNLEAYAAGLPLPGAVDRVNKY